LAEYDALPKRRRCDDGLYRWKRPSLAELPSREQCKANVKFQKACERLDALDRKITEAVKNGWNNCEEKGEEESDEVGTVWESESDIDEEGNAADGEDQDEDDDSESEGRFYTWKPLDYDTKPVVHLVLEDSERKRQKSALEDNVQCSSEPGTNTSYNSEYSSGSGSVSEPSCTAAESRSPDTQSDLKDGLEPARKPSLDVYREEIRSDGAALLKKLPCLE
jgi:hypothetical protein